MSMAIPKKTGREMINEVCAILGITSPNVRAVEITANCNGPVTVSIEFLVTVDEGAKIAQLMPKYQELRDLNADEPTITPKGLDGG
jgi:hypothetical protein